MASKKPLVLTSGGIEQLQAADTLDNSAFPARKVGFLQPYTGSDDTSQGWFSDYDGKWVYLTLDGIRTIGNASSGAAIAAAWTQTLFEHLWSQYDNTRCPLLDSSGSPTSRGASGAADWAANRRITLPDFRGRTVIGAGTGSSLTARTKGSVGGAETHTLTTNEMPSHSHTSVDNLIKYVGTGGNGAYTAGAAVIGTSTNVQIVNTTGGGAAHNNMQPWTAEHVLVAAGAR